MKVPALQLLQGLALMGCDMVGFITFDFILRVFTGRMMGVSFVLKVGSMYADDSTGDPAGFRIPGNVIAYLKMFFHHLGFFKEV